MEQRDILGTMLADKRTTRRDFLVSATALGLTAATASTMWGKAAKAAPIKGGHMKIGIGGGATSDSLDPATFDATFMITTGNSFRDNVTEIGPDNSLQGALVESWEPSDDAKTWVFKLRKGVEWHNGKSLEPEDIIASLNLHRGEESKSGAKGVVAGIEDIKADGKDGVIFTLKDSDADFPYILTDYHLNIVPAKDGKADWQAGVGTGAYTLESFEPGVKAEVKLNRAPERRDNRGAARRQPGRSQDHQLAEKAVFRPDPRRPGAPAPCLPDEHGDRALRQQRRAPRAQICHRPGGVPAEDPEGLRDARERFSDRPPVSLPCKRHPAAGL
jgi:hypothetical protein